MVLPELGAVYLNIPIQQTYLKVYLKIKLRQSVGLIMAKTGKFYDKKRWSHINRFSEQSQRLTRFLHFFLFPWQKNTICSLPFKSYKLHRYKVCIMIHRWIKIKTFYGFLISFDIQYHRTGRITYSFRSDPCRNLQT